MCTNLVVALVDKILSLEELLDRASTLNSLQAKSAVPAIVQSAATRPDGVQTVFEWWFGNPGFSQAIITSNFQHQIIDEQNAHYIAQMQYRALDTMDRAVALHGFCQCHDCDLILSPLLADFGDQNFDELSKSSQQRALEMMRAVGKPLSKDMVERLVMPLDVKTNDWIGFHHQVSNEAARLMLERREQIDVACTLLEKNSIEEREAGWLREVYLDPATTDYKDLQRLSEALRYEDYGRLTERQPDFQELSSAEFFDTLTHYSRPLEWPEWADSSAAPTLQSLVNDCRERLMWTATSVDPRSADILQAAKTHLDQSELKSIAKFLYEAWIASGHVGNGMFAFMLAMIFGDELTRARARLGVGELPEPQQIQAFRAMAYTPGGFDWIHHWQRSTSDYQVRGAARNLLNQHKGHKFTKRLISGLEPYIADTTIEESEPTAEELRTVLHRAFLAGRSWSGDYFASVYRNTDALEGVIVSVDGLHCTLIDGEFVDLEDRTIVLSHNSQVRVSHPAEIPHQHLALWEQRLVDFMLVAPFGQLSAAVVERFEIDGLLQDASSYDSISEFLNERGWSWDEDEETLTLSDAASGCVFEWSFDQWGFSLSKPPKRFVSRVGEDLKHALAAES